MKKYFTLIALTVFLGNHVFSQEDYTKKADQQDQDEIKTLFHKGKPHKKPAIGYFIGPEFAYTQFTGNKNVFLLGLTMGVTFNHWVSVGLSGYGIVNSGNIQYDQLVYDDFDKKWQSANLYGGYGGLLLEFLVIPKSPVHVSFPILIGGGGLTYMYRPDYIDKYDWGGYQTVDWDAFFVIQPGVRVEFNIVKFFRIGVGASYRYTPDLDLVNTSKNLINQFNANVSLKFGKF
ncbi:hypothetical protein ACFLS7_05260 [Bacteroidota bacterium]